jgi:hypothetical protein
MVKTNTRNTSYFFTMEIRMILLAIRKQTWRWVGQAAILQEETCVDSLLHHKKGKLGWFLETNSSETFHELLHLMFKHSTQLTVTNAISENNDSIRQSLVHFVILA